MYLLKSVIHYNFMYGNLKKKLGDFLENMQYLRVEINIYRRM